MKFGLIVMMWALSFQIAGAADQPLEFVKKCRVSSFDVEVARKTISDLSIFPQTCPGSVCEVDFHLKGRDVVENRLTFLGHTYANTEEDRVVFLRIAPDKVSYFSMVIPKGKNYRLGFRISPDGKGGTVVTRTTDSPEIYQLAQFQCD